jgi:S-adenosylmethionine hydrolase
MKIITLTTDFGYQDSYVGQVKGAILNVEPEARIVDLCHAVPAHDIRAGAYILETGYAAFPAGTIHVAVVDPGVGSDRRMLAARAGQYYFLAPDNGLSRVLEHERLSACRVLQNRSLFGPRESMTFAGRDVFGPAAAWLSRGVDLARMGPPADDPVRLEGTRPRLQLGRSVRVPVLLADRFGNLVLDVTADALTTVLGHAPDEQTPLRLTAEGGEVRRFLPTYTLADDREPFFLINSAGYLEVAVRTGRADESLGLRPGMHPELKVGR